MVIATLPDIDQGWAWLADVPDPEIPVISVTDLGIVRGVSFNGDCLVVKVTPTYSGCPATAVVELDIETHLLAQGVEDVDQALLLRLTFHLDLNDRLGSSIVGNGCRPQWWYAFGTTCTRGTKGGAINGAPASSSWTKGSYCNSNRWYA